MTGDVLSRLRELASSLLFILLNPAWNTKAALALYTSIGLLLLLVVVAVVFFVIGASERTGAVESNAGARTDTGPPKEAAGAPKEERTTSPRDRALLVVGSVLVLICVWVVAGFTTSNPALCKNCHWPAAAHAQASKGSDPHSKVACVYCHETGGILGRYVTGLPARALHLVQASANASPAVDYGQVTAKACSSCHGASLAGTTTNTKRGLRVSHEEPMDASATCLDCHKMRGGIVAAHNAGMDPCLRCHDDVGASAKCATCHVKNAAAAARVRTTSLARPQIEEVSCGGCHDEVRDCDPCHGMRMPHTNEFMSHAHARAAAVDFWYNGGKSCGRCHTESRRPCRCHSGQLGHAHGTTPWLAKGHQTAQVSACNTCHATYAYVTTRDFCKDVCHSEAAIAASPR